MQVILTLFALHISSQRPGALRMPAAAQPASIAAAAQQLSKESSQAQATAPGEESQMSMAADSQMEDSQLSQGPESQAPESQSQGPDSQAPEGPPAANESRTTGGKKRKWKSMPARRWTGGLPGAAGGFSWSRKTSSSKVGSASADGAKSSGGDGAADESETLSFEPQALSARFDLLIEKLCLVAIQTELSSLTGDFDMLGSSATDGAGAAKKEGEDPPHAAKNRTRPAPPQPQGGRLLFGTAARHREAKDDRDEVQWLCSSIVEPLFSRTLPRQCSALRGKCFVAGSTPGPAYSNTPARSAAALGAGAAGVAGGGGAANRGRSTSSTRVSTEAEKHDTNLARREEERKQRERATVEAQPALKEALQMDQAARARRGSRLESVEPDSLTVRSRPKLVPREITVQPRVFKRSASAILPGVAEKRVKTEATKEGKPVDGEDSQQQQQQKPRGGVFKSAVNRVFERTQSLAPSARLERAQSLAPPSVKSRSTTPASDSGDKPEKTSRQSSKAPSPVPPPLTITTATPAPKQKKQQAEAEEDNDSDSSLSTSDTSSDNMSDIEDPAQEEETEILVPHSRHLNSARSTSQALGKWMAIDTQPKSAGLSKWYDSDGEDDGANESQAPLPPLPRSANPFKRAGTPGESQGLQRVSSGRNPFAKGREPSRSSFGPNLSVGDSQGAADGPIAESCPADLGRMWRGAPRVRDV